MIYHVSINGSDSACGSETSPFRTINHAAQLAMAGDTVVVHGGTYRESVDPKNGGTDGENRIVYTAADGERPIIKGSELVHDWKKVKGNVWKAILPNSLFGSFNPFAEAVEGDWLLTPEDHRAHLGDVYLNGISMYEACDENELFSSAEKEHGYGFDRCVFEERILHHERTRYRWLAKVGDGTTELLCNFGEFDPNRETVEVNARMTCFYPSKTGVNYITLRGFEIAHAATPWAPPTSHQIGMVGPHWSRGWIIENNILHDAKCCAVSLGKEESTGHHYATRIGRKSGYLYQMEAVFAASRLGWSKETVGSHVVRNNEIYDCGQNGIVGHMGAAFSRIEDNHIYNIAKKHEFWGYEVGGIKLHAAIDVLIKGNHIHHCNLGTWLDWEAQGARLTKNFYHHNDRDLMIEVTHGPCLLDHNIFLSPYALDNCAQGTAYVHNLFAGVVFTNRVLNRATPYHVPHSTDVAGCAVVYGGDDRLMNNLFLGEYQVNAPDVGNFTSCYDAYSTAEEYPALLRAQGNADHDKFYNVPQPVYIEENAYAGYDKPCRTERSPVFADGMRASLDAENGEWILTLTVPASVADANCMPVTTARLGTPRITEEAYETPDGEEIDFTSDFFGTPRAGAVIPGPFATLKSGAQRIVTAKTATQT